MVSSSGRDAQRESWPLPASYAGIQRISLGRRRFHATEAPRMRLTASSSWPATSAKLTNRADISAPEKVICWVDFTARGQPGPSAAPIRLDTS